jgi:hypothetical protein
MTRVFTMGHRAGTKVPAARYADGFPFAPPPLARTPTPGRKMELRFEQALNQ